MDVLAQRFCHLRSTNIGDSVKGQAVVDLVILVQVLPYRVDDKTKKVGVLMHQQRDCEISLATVTDRDTWPLLEHRGLETHDLLLAVLVARNQIDRLHMSNVHFVAQNVRIEHLCDISTKEQRKLSTRTPDEQVIILTFSFGSHPNCHLIRVRVVKAALGLGRATIHVPLNFFRIFAISLFIRFSSKSRTRAPRISAMN
jgi:hypothetical protein